MAPPKWVFQIGTKFELKDPKNKELAVAVYNNYKKNGAARALVDKLFVKNSFDLKSPSTYSKDLLHIAQVPCLRWCACAVCVCLEMYTQQICIVKYKADDQQQRPSPGVQRPSPGVQRPSPGVQRPSPGVQRSSAPPQPSSAAPELAWMDGMAPGSPELGSAVLSAQALSPLPKASDLSPVQEKAVHVFSQVLRDVIVKPRAKVYDPQAHVPCKAQAKSLHKTWPLKSYKPFKTYKKKK